MKYFLIASIACCCISSEVAAQRGGGGMNRGGGFSGGAGMARPTPQAQRPQPQMQRPQQPMQRPQPQVQRPQPQMQRPQQPMQRPSVSTPNLGGVNRPTPGFNQSPNMQRPNMPTAPSTRPTPQPGFHGPVGGITPGNMGPGAINRPGYPSTGGLPSSRPRPPIQTYPGNNRPGVQPPITTLPGVTRPNPGNVTRPINPVNPGLPTTRPVTPGTRPITPGIPTTRPRPLPGGGADVGLERPIRPTPPITRPTPPIGGGNINRPGVVNPPIGNRPIVRPPTTRPIINQPIVNRPQINNNIINTRPNWVNINNVNINRIDNRWNQTIINRPGMHNYWNNHPNRMNYWNGWGNGVRNNWRYYHQHNNWFGQSWWNRYSPAYGGWHYHHWLPYYPYNYWWTVPTWSRVTTWFSWNLAANAAWQQPIYYDYGQGGNVYTQNNMVYIGGQEVSTPAEFAESAAVLATVEPPKDEAQAAAAEWMPLGTFAMSTGERDTEPTRVVQLAISKDGILSGTLYNYQTEQSAAIQGKVDQATQRVAFRIGERDNLIAETGLYNLTQDEVPVLVHFGTEKTEKFLFIRLKNEEQNQGQLQGAASPPP